MVWPDDKPCSVGDAVVRSVETAGRTVAISALTVAVSLAALLVFAADVLTRQEQKVGDWKKALALQDKLMPLHDSMFIETNPAPVK